jgi:apolipoprotein N-acyltransferase
VLVNEAGTIYFRGTRTLRVTRDARWVERHSYYTEHGDWFVAVSAVLAVLALAGLTVGASPAKPEAVDHGQPL